MDIIMNMLSLAKDVNSTEKELRKLNFQIKYQLQKAQKLAKGIGQIDQNISFIYENFFMKINEAEKYTNKFDELFNQEKLGIKEKIIFNLPFDQTKKEANLVLEDLKKAISDVKESQNEGQDNDPGIKRKIKDDNSQSSPLNSQNQQADEKKIENKLEEIYEMGPTIKEDEIVFSQQHKQIIVEFTITLEGNKQLVNCVAENAPSLLKVKQSISLSEKLDEKKLYSVARANFKAVYHKVKPISKQIDGISTKGHFHLILKKLENQNMPPSSQKHRKSENSEMALGRVSSKERNEEQQFFSFPEQNVDIYNSFKILMRKQDKSKNVYIYREQKWLKIEEEEYQVINGDKLAAYYNQKSEGPSIIYSINYQIATK